MNNAALFDKDLMDKLRSLADDGVNNAATGFSGMVGRKIHVHNPTSKLVPVMSIPELAGRPDNDAVGIYLRFTGDVSGQIMLIIPFQKAMELVDLMMQVPAGTTQQLGSLERSALGELGNLCGSFFLNSIARTTKAKFHPTPPAVMVDMVGAILDIVVATSGGISENALLMQANLTDGDRMVEADFWVIPDMHSLNEMIAKNIEK
jgi:chemotaxis protein CheC